MKRIIVAPDSFKESLTAPGAAKAITAGFRAVFSQAEIVEIPMSDGGEGLVQTLVEATGGEIFECKVTGPLGEPVDASFGLLGDSVTAVIEMAAASGLPLVPKEKRNPLFTTTYGTGELISCALDRSCKKIIIGIGGSATNDGGSGMAQALGVRLLTAAGADVAAGARGLQELATVNTEKLDSRLAAVEVIAAVDVNNPLCGPNGASYVYGPQKGATAEMLPRLDKILNDYAAVLKKDLGADVANLPGAGAAGGLGAGLVAFLGAGMRPGVEVVLDLLKMEEVLRKGADLVITGEGRLNRQTIYGKVPVGVAELAKKYGVPVIALVGAIGKGAEDVLEYGIDAYFSIIPRPMELAECLARAEENLSAAALQCARLLKALSSEKESLLP